jgi:hypothetical protein
MANSAKCTVHVSNERVTVNEWRFAPGANTGWHRHEYDYVIVPTRSFNSASPTSGRLASSTMSSTPMTASSPSSRSRSNSR